MFISTSVCPSHHLDFYLLFLRSFCLFVFLLLFHRPLFLGQFPFFCLWPSFLPSCRKAINPAAMQQAAANHWAPEDEGRKEEEGEMGTWKCWGAVATKGEGRGRKEQRDATPRRQPQLPPQPVSGPHPSRERTPGLSFCSEAGYLGPFHILPKL